MARVTIKESAKVRTGISKRTGKEYSINEQKAILETDNMKMPVDLALPDGHKGYAVGEVFNWDIESDMRAGRYGPELTREWTLIPVRAATAKAA